MLKRRAWHHNVNAHAWLCGSMCRCSAIEHICGSSGITKTRTRRVQHTGHILVHGQNLHLFRSEPLGFAMQEGLQGIPADAGGED